MVESQLRERKRESEYRLLTLILKLEIYHDSRKLFSCQSEHTWSFRAGCLWQSSVLPILHRPLISWWKSFLQRHTKDIADPSSYCKNIVHTLSLTLSVLVLHLQVVEFMINLIYSCIVKRPKCLGLKMSSTKEFSGRMTLSKQHLKLLFVRRKTKPNNQVLLECNQEQQTVFFLERKSLLVSAQWVMVCIW